MRKGVVNITYMLCCTCWLLNLPFSPFTTMRTFSHDFYVFCKECVMSEGKNGTFLWVCWTPLSCLLREGSPKVTPPSAPPPPPPLPKVGRSLQVGAQDPVAWEAARFEAV